MEQLQHFIGRTGTIHLLGHTYNVRIAAIKRVMGHVRLHVTSSQLPKRSCWVLQKYFTLDVKE